jgi:hypothetical protein
MLWYENINSNDYKVYHDILDLVKQVPQIYTQNNTIIFMKNSMSGLGSQITIFTQNAHFTNSCINNNIICIPHYSENNQQFKYHEEKYNNSFFLYFKLNDYYFNLLNNRELDITKWNIYFCNSITWIKCHPEFDRYSFDSFYSKQNYIFYNYFKSRFKLNNNNIFIKKPDNLSNIKLIGIHLRSKYHSKAEYSQFGNVDIKKILIKLKRRFDDLYKGNYSIFIATDVSIYISYCKEIFLEDSPHKKLFYIQNIDRVNTDDADSIPLLEHKKGYKLGSDILSECKILSECDELWLSTSNISCIVEFIGRNTNNDNIHWLYGTI